MNATLEVVSNEVIIFGAGTEIREDGKIVPAQVGMERVNRFLQYYIENRRAFASSDAFVLCSGGYSQMQKGMEAPDDDEDREGIVTADCLVQNGVPHSLIRVESDSTSTVKNFTYSIEQGFIVPSLYNEERRLGVISHPKHLLRAALFAGKVGLPREALSLIATQEKDSALREFVIRNGYRVLLIGAYGTEELNTREELPKIAIGAVRSRLKSQRLAA